MLSLLSAAPRRTSESRAKGMVTRSFRIGTFHRGPKFGPGRCGASSDLPEWRPAPILEGDNLFR